MVQLSFIFHLMNPKKIAKSFLNKKIKLLKYFNFFFFQYLKNSLTKKI